MFIVRSRNSRYTHKYEYLKKNNWQGEKVSNKKVQNPNDKGNTAFIWTIVAVIVVAAVVIGLVVVNSRNDRAAAVAAEMTEVDGVAMDFDNEAGIIKLSPEGESSAPSAQLFEDYSCTYCAQLATDTDDQMLQELEDGDLTVEIRPLTFLDRGAEGNSTHVLAAALAAVHSGDVELYWNFRDHMLQNQQEIYNNWEPEDFANLAEQFGADQETVDAMKNETYLEDAVRIGQGNADVLNEQTGEVSSPRVLVDGEDVDVPNINEWIDAVAA